MSAGMAWLGLCIFMAWTIEAMSGFGSIVIALSLGALFLPMAALLPVLVTLNVVTSSWLVWRHRAHIDAPLLLRRIAPLMLVGMVGGVVLRDALPVLPLKVGFAVLLLWFAGKELWALRRQQRPIPHSPLMLRGLMTAAGVTHGLFAAGGPLLVYALAGNNIPKARFRATLISVWLLLNSVLFSVFMWQGKVLPQAHEIALYLPVVVASVWLGGYLHHGLNEAKFRVMVFCLLAVLGAALLLSQISLLLRA